MALTNDDITAQNFKDFYNHIYTLLHSSSGGGSGHTIVDPDDMEMTSRSNLKFGGDFEVDDDDTNDETIVKPYRLTSSDFDEIMSVAPSSISMNACFTPIGTIISVMGTHAPYNYLVCDGSVVNIADYPELAGYFESQFGEVNHFGGDGVTTFAVPDLRGEFLRGTGTNSHENQGSGDAVGVHQDGSEISGTYTYSTNSLGVSDSKTWTDSTYWDDVNPDAVHKKSGLKYISNANSSSTGDTNFGAYTSRPTNTSVLYCIATKNIVFQAGMNFSTDEQVVGTWIDGKPLYQKTVELINPTNSTTIINGIDHVVKVNGYFTHGTQSSTFPYSDSGGYICDGYIDDSSHTYILQIYKFTVNKLYACVQYTKTTD